MKIGVFLPNWIGDVCMATPTLLAIRRFYSDAEIIGIARPGPSMLVTSQPFIDRTISYKAKAKPPLLNRRRLVQTLRREKVDLAVLLTNSLGTALLATLSGIPRRVGYGRDGRGLLLTDRLIPDKAYIDRNHPEKQSLVEYYLRIAKHLGCDTSDRRLFLATENHHLELARSYLKNSGLTEDLPLVVINNNAAKSPSRLLSDDKLVEIATRLVNQYDIQVLFHCGPQERESSRKVTTFCNHPRIRSMADWAELPLGISQAVMAMASLVISSDSGARLLAVANNKPVITYFGSSIPEVTRTFNIEESYAEVKLDCRPCNQETCPLQHNDCIKRISAEQIYLLAKMRLDNLIAAARR